VAALLVLLVPAGAFAQESVGQPSDQPVEVQADIPARRQSIGIRGFASFEMNRMAASKSFDAVVGTSDLSGFGAGGEVLRLWNSVFARIGFSRITRDGTRVVVFEDEVSPVGVATTVTMRPLEVAGGWRFGRGGRLVPYAGGGLVRVAYEETTSFDQTADDTSGTFNGSLLFGGVDVQIAGPLGFGAEFQHRRLADALGAGGASAAFGETDLGGLTFRIWIGVGR
jgi:hypothetical protein